MINMNKNMGDLLDKGKEIWPVVVSCAVGIMLLCTLSGCQSHATHEELIDWFQENYTDTPLEVSHNAAEDDAGTISYEAYLKDAPELVFHLQSERVDGIEHEKIFQNVTDFKQVYGAHYFAQYQAQHSVQYWRPNAKYAFYDFPIEALYNTPAELDAAAEELLKIQQFLMEQIPAVTEKYIFTFQSPVCAPAQYYYSLGSGTLTVRTDDQKAETLIQQKVKDLRSELVVWCRFYDLHTEWFSEEEAEQALAYTQTEEYDGRSIYIGAWKVSDPKKGELRLPLVAPDTQSVSFAQLYRLLLALEWETLAGNETDFTFVGADGSAYALSYTLREDEGGNLVNRCTKDGVPMDISDGCFSSYSLLTDMTGIILQEEGDVTYRGPEDEGIVRLPARPHG